MIERAAGLQTVLSLENLSWHVGEVARLPFPADQFDVVLDLRWAGYRFYLELGALLEASFA